jgi:hypothetical protein
MSPPPSETPPPETPPPETPVYRAFTITPSIAPHTSKTTWTSPTVKETNFPQNSLISELSALQENDKSPIADKIARLSTDQRAAVYNVLVDLVGEEKGEADEDEESGERLEWSVCEAVRMRDTKRGRTKCVRIFFVRAPVVVQQDVKEKVPEAEEGKGKEKEERSRSRGNDKVAEEAPPKDERPEKSRRKPARDRERSEGKGKETERTEEKKSRRRATKSRHRKKGPFLDDSDDSSCDEHSDTAISSRSRTLRRPKPRSLSQRFKPLLRETNPTAYGRPEQWESPVIIPPHFPVRGYPPAPQNDYHIRAAYEAGQRDAIAERMRNAALDRQSMPHGPSHVISFERLRPGFEDEFRSDGSYSQMYVGHPRQTKRYRIPVLMTR